MASRPAERKHGRSLAQRWQRLVQTRLWRMDIHPTAWIARSALMDRTWPSGLHVGAGCVIDEEAVLLTHDLTRGVYLDTWIGEDSVIGARAIVLPGVTVGRGCTVAPGALVTRDVPDDSLVVGNPGRVQPAATAPLAAAPR